MIHIMHFMKGDGFGKEYIVIAEDEDGRRDALAEGESEGYFLATEIGVQGHDEEFSGFPTNRRLE